MSEFVFFVESPLLTAEKYAEKIGVSTDSVRSKISTGAIPTVKQGKHRLVNYALIVKQSLEAESCHK